MRKCGSAATMVAGGRELPDFGRSCTAGAKALGRGDTCYAVMRVITYVSQGALPFQITNGSVSRVLANEVKGLRLSTLRLKGLPN